MGTRQVRLSVAARGITSSGITVEPGTYSGTEEEVPDHTAPDGLGRPRFVIDNYSDEKFLDVTDMVENGDIIVVVIDPPPMD